MMRLLVLAGMLVALAGCGKVGPNTPPGPADKVIISRLQYPSQ